MMKLSIVILTHNSEKWIETSLKSLLVSLDKYTVEWIVVDNGSSDDSHIIVRSIVPQAHIILNQHNLGVARARNQGIKLSTGEYILLLDDDTQVMKNSINMMCDYLNRHPECGMVGPQLVNPDGTVQANSLQLPSVRLKCKRIFKKVAGKPSANIYKEFIDAGKPFQPGYLIGACQLIRQEAITSVGLLDERIFYGPEDADYCIRLKNKGFEVVCLPTVKVIHGYQHKSYSLKKMGLLWYHLTGLCYFWRKHRSIKF
jgi:GT2 family glycosyltransferase